MITFEIINKSSLRDSVAVSRVGMYMACRRDAILDSGGKQIISIECVPVLPDKNRYIVTDYE